MKKCKPFVMDYAEGDDRGDVVFKDDSLTRQADAEEVSIANVLKRCNASNEMIFPKVQPIYGDFTSSGDYLSRMKSVADFNSQFERFPVELKEFFKNDPSTVIDFLADKRNMPKARDLGLLDPSMYEGKVWDEKSLDFIIPVKNTEAGAPPASGAPAGGDPAKAG